MTERIRTILEELSRTAVDWRTTVYDVRLVEEQGRLILEGEVFDPALHDRVVQTLAAALPGMEIVDQLGVLINGPDYSWAIVSRPILNLRRQPDHSAELLTQATFGEPVEVLRRQGEWSFVRVSDGYLGWVHALGLLSVSQEHACSYRVDASHLVGQGIVPCYDETGRQVSLLPFGVPVQVERVVAGTAYLRTPEGVYWRVAEDALVKVEERPRPNQEGIARLCSMLERFVGVPYLWGGSTPFGFDCSGLVQTALRFLGMNVPRDADMQSQMGLPVDQEDIRKGDLLFFTSYNLEDDKRHQDVTHVAVALDGDRLLHANQRFWAVTVNSLNPDHPDSFPQLRPLLVAVRRYTLEDEQ